MAKPTHPLLSEEELGKKWDQCLYNAMIKMSGGFVIGAISSVLIFKRSRWPLLVGAGFGLGFAYSQCQKDLNETLALKKGQKLMCGWETSLTWLRTLKLPKEHHWPAGSENAYLLFYRKVDRGNY